jgi:hypothetical protein
MTWFFKYRRAATHADYAINFLLTTEGNNQNVSSQAAPLSNESLNVQASLSAFPNRCKPLFTWFEYSIAGLELYPLPSGNFPTSFGTCPLSSGNFQTPSMYCQTAYSLNFKQIFHY